MVSLSGGSIQTSGPLGSAGVSPGGIVRGAAVIGNTMFAVSDQGGLYRVGLNGGLTQPALGPAGNVGTYVTTSFDLTGIQFTGWSQVHLMHRMVGIHSCCLVSMCKVTCTRSTTAGELQPVFANGATSISTGVFNANGLAFSTLDFNLWHASGQRNGDAGHGQPATPNDSQGVTLGGGSSLYFGYESAGANGVPDLTGPASPGITNSYNFPGGAAGAIESANFDLSGLGASDLTNVVLQLPI